MQEPDDLERSIAAAKDKLAKFDAGAGAGVLLTRLRASSPLHPLLLMRFLGGLGAAVAGVGAIGVMVASVASREVALAIADLQSAVIVPLPLVLLFLAGCCGVMLVAGHFGAVAAARGAPLLPQEAKLHQRLMSDLQQLEAQRAVKDRMTPRGATPRLLERRPR